MTVVSLENMELIMLVDEEFGAGGDPLKIFATEVQYTNSAWDFGENPLEGSRSLIFPYSTQDRQNGKYRCCTQTCQLLPTLESATLGTTPVREFQTFPYSI